MPSVYKTLKLNDEEMMAAVESARGSKLTLANEVKKTYYNILLGEESLAVLRSSEETITQTVEDVKTKFDAGLASEYDYITASVQLSNLQPSIIETQNSIEISKKMLKMYMGLPLTTNIEVSGTLDSFAMPGMQNIFAGASDISGNNELRAMDIEINVLQRTLEVNRTQRLPTLSGFGNFSLSGRDPISFAGINGGSEFLWTYPISAGVNISIPIFSGLKNVNKDKQLKNNIEQLKVQRDYLEESINVQIQTSINTLISAESKMIANKATIEQAQKGYDISRTRYDAGMGTMLEVNNAELQLTQAKLNYTQAIYDYLSAQADYDKLLGKEEINQ